MSFETAEPSQASLPVRADATDERLSMRGALALARETLGMDLAFVGELTGERQIVRMTASAPELGEGGGRADVPQIAEGDSRPLEESYCARVVAGELPNVIPDTGANPRTRELAVTSEVGIGAYAGVAIRFSEGRLYGVLCCVSRNPEPSLAERDLGLVRVLAQLVAEQLEREALLLRARRLEVEAAGADALLKVIRGRDRYTGAHSAEVLQCSRAVARELGLPPEEVARVEQIAMLHDIGKIAIPDAVLHSTGSLSEHDWEVVRQHPVAGERIAASLPDLAPLAPAIRAAHERWDGKGYPDGLRGEQIPIGSRIVLVCDAYYAMRSERPYRPAMPAPEALAELRRNAGTQFCPHAVEAFLRARS